MTTQVGVVGLGAMGAPMADRLQQAGVLACAWNRTPERVAEWAAARGIRLAESPAALAGACNVIITCVSREADVLEVLDRMSGGFQPESVVIDTSTISADGAQRAAAQVAEHNVTFLDAPVSGGVEGARNGTMVMMVGGDAAALDAVRDVLAHISRRVAHMGPIGSGQATKAVNQIIVAGLAQCVSEALAFGRRMQLDLDKVIDIVSGGAAANWFLEHRGPTMVRGAFAPGFKVALHHKDLTICRDMAAGMAEHSPLDVVEMTLKHYERLMAEGHGDEDISSLFRIKSSASP